MPIRSERPLRGPSANDLGGPFVQQGRSGFQALVRGLVTKFAQDAVARPLSPGANLQLNRAQPDRAVGIALRQ